MNLKNYFESKREVKWCPGCGNYAILMSMQKILFSLGIKNNEIVFVSGIGCSGRFPYYINTYGIHSLHGRAAATATGLKLMRDDLTVWMVVGDGDAFSIGLSHIIHLIRRNININILFINNKIYALTKGQYSPTSNIKSITKSSPYGSLEPPINPVLLTLNSGCSFVARCVDTDTKNLQEIIKKAMEHNGTSFIEVLQNCNVFNNQIYNKLTDKNVKNDNIVYLKNNSELIFGENNNKKILLNKNLNLYTSTINNKETLIFKNEEENILQIMLANIQYETTPYPLGIFRNFKKTTYEENLKKSISISRKIHDFSNIFD